MSGYVWCHKAIEKMEKAMNLLVKLYRIKNRMLRRIIEKVVLYFEGGQAFSPSIRRLYSRYHGINIGYGSYGGCFTYENFPKPCEIHIGNYCSIGSNLKVFRANHPSHYFTTAPFLYNPSFGYVKKDMLDRPALQIGNDVWIGSSVIICPGCYQIGNGAIIGAGSVITHDVEPYTIVAGNPARVIRCRFNDRQIHFLEESKWWENEYDDLSKIAESLNRSISTLED